MQGLIVSSVAFFDASSSRVFRSEIPGRSDAQVGRSPGARKSGTQAPGAQDGLSDAIEWEDIWNRSAGQYELPKELEGISRKDAVHSIISLTDNAPQGFLNALGAFPRATKGCRHDKLGLVASSTPFVTGRPFTLFHNGSSYSSGAVGMALSSTARPSASTAFPGLRPITGDLTVTGSEGNLIQELNNKNPSQLLLDAIQKSGLDGNSVKDHDFYIGVMQDGTPAQVYHIMSGDPSRGTIALDSEVAPATGAIVQLFHGPAPGAVDVPKSYLEPQDDHKSMTFIASSMDCPVTAVPQPGSDEVQVIEGTFVASSENGFLLSRCEDGIAEPTWKCTAPGGLARLTWSD
ncbi:hypothetical protein EWM64_g10294 [Hericium alpestre]|uniref:FIST domain-containing protein n=1 Tax=Hericium alpestre TaxID=135208 RepID=A0A4Y9ZJ79_9AGAM|nr:hypothetical protein EWM64_g10294 [Hericium alpestre]